MSYNKKVWINNQTKVNATNMNHIETGLEEAAAIADAALEAARVAGEDIEELHSGFAVVEATATRAEQLATATYPVAAQAHEEAHAANESLKLKQDKLVAGTNIKTINGASILGEGDIKVATDLSDYYKKGEIDAKLDGITASEYKFYETAVLNDLLDQGAYEIDEALDHPEDTAARGILIVSKLTDGKVHQEWQSETNRAVRITDGGEEPVPAETYILNITCGDEKTTYESHSNEQVQILLSAGKEYLVEGELAGQIAVGEDGVDAPFRTKLTLAGVNVHSTFESAINYRSANKSLVVEILNETSNKLVTNDLYPDLNDRGRSSTATIYSADGNITLTGTGTLCIEDEYGHGVKASEVVVNGEPKIDIDVLHDAYHASKALRITGGDHAIVGANDAFSSGTNDDPEKKTAEITITGGNFYLGNIGGSAFETKSKLGKYMLIGANFEISRDVAELFNEAGSTKFEVIDTCAFTGIEEGSSFATKLASRTNTLESLFGDAKVEFVVPPSEGEPETRTEIAPDSSGIYLLDKPNSAGRYELSGNFTGKSFTITAKSVNLTSRGIFVKDTDDTKNEYPLFEYKNTSGRLQVEFIAGDNNTGKNYINYIYKKGGSIFDSASNLSLKLKAEDATKNAEGVVTIPQMTSVLYMSCEGGDGLVAPVGRTAIASDGICYLTGCKHAVNASNIWLGNECVDDGIYKKSDLSAYIIDNECDFKIIWKPSDAYKKYGYVTANEYLMGTCILGGTFEFVSEDKRYLEAMQGNIAELGASYKNTAMVYCRSTEDFEYAEHVRFYDLEFVGEELETLHISAEGEEEYRPAEGWHVYSIPTNVYTKTEADAKATAIAESKVQALKVNYDAIILELEKRIEALEKKEPESTDPELSEDGNLTLHNVELSDSGDLDLKDLATLSDDGSLKL